MLKAFHDGADLHTRTASLIFKKAESAVDKLTERYPTKTLNFRVLYVGAAHGLSQQRIAMGYENPVLRQWTVPKCEKLIARWFQVYAGVAQAIKAAGDEGRRYGYVRDRWGRRRNLPALG